MSEFAKKVVLHSKKGYSDEHIPLLSRMIDDKVLLFCTVGRDCELWHDIMDEIFVGYGEERDHFQITTWHNDETLEEVIEFAKFFHIDCPDNETVQVIEI